MKKKRLNSTSNFERTCWNQERLRSPHLESINTSNHSTRHVHKIFFKMSWLAQIQNVNRAWLRSKTCPGEHHRRRSRAQFVLNPAEIWSLYVFVVSAVYVFRLVALNALARNVGGLFASRGLVLNEISPWCNPLRSWATCTANTDTVVWFPFVRTKIWCNKKTACIKSSQ